MQRKAKKAINFLLVMVLAITLVSAFQLKSAFPRAATSDASVSLKAGNTWQSAGSTFLQVDGTITNKGKASITNWKVTVPLAPSGAVNSCWNMDYDLSDGILTITPSDHNQTVPAGGSITFGMI